MDEPVFTLQDVAHCYGERTVLRVPALSIGQGEIFALVGPSGAGKSTLLRLLALLETPTRGQVVFHARGRQVSRATASIEERRQIAMVFQRPALLSRSVRANVAYGLRARGERNSRRIVDSVLDRLALTALADARPGALSGGEMQRVAVARAVVLKPRVLLLDEPTANLDPTNVRLIEHLIQEQRAESGATIVLVTHHIFQARRLATRVALLLDGDLVEVAPAAQFFNAPQDPRAAAFLSGDLVY
jgi:tungstate transport system ATP-binding protein